MTTAPIPWDSVADDNLTTRQAAEWIRRSDDTLKRWRRMRIGPPHFTINGRVLYSKRDLQAWVEDRRRQSQEGRA